MFFAVFFGVAAGTTVGLYFAFAHDLPEIQGLETHKPSAITKIISADNKVLAEWFSQRRDPVPLSAMPEYLKKAIIATEDQAFYSHSGVAPKGLARAVIKNIRAGRFKEGASTITQQLAKTLFLSPEKTLSRKIKEAVLAIQLERRYTKNEILELYLNQIYFGSGAYGVSSAAKKFFNKDLGELNLGECALIAGMPKAPSRYSPLVNLKLATWRRDVVLSQLAQVGWISRAQYAQTVNAPVITAKQGVSEAPAPYFVEMVRRVLEDALGDQVLYGQGVVVHTSLNYDMQKQARQALVRGVARISKRQGFKAGQLNGALVCMDPATGQIFALVGGTDFSKSRFDRATMAQRQPGSAFKPFVYACAVEQGLDQSTLILDEPVVFPGPARDKGWSPENYSNNYLGEISFRKALACSQNIPAARLIHALSPARMVGFAQALGITSEMKPYLSLALGSFEVTLLELTSAYAAFVNNGEWIEPHSILKVLDRNGRVIFKSRPQKRAGMSEQGAAVIVNMLEAVIKEGTGKKAKILPGQVAGKTGTTTKCKDALFVGFSPSLAAGVWVGRDDNLSMGKYETGSSAALPIWVEFMSYALKDRPLEYFPVPDGVVAISVDPVSGRVAEPGRGTMALFIKGTEPEKGKPLKRLLDKFPED